MSLKLKCVLSCYEDMLKGKMMLILVMLKETVMIEFDHDVCAVINLKICLLLCH